MLKLKQSRTRCKRKTFSCCKVEADAIAAAPAVEEVTEIVEAEASTEETPAAEENNEETQA
jgi:small subunit ribosomal protein S16